MAFGYLLFMDPAMFAVTATTLGSEWAIAKTVFAISIGLFGGYGAMLVERRTQLFDNPLKGNSFKSCCSSGLQNQTIKWRFWEDTSMIRVFRSTFVENFLFLFKWMFVAYFVEAMLVAYMPADLISDYFGQDTFFSILTASIFGGFAYLNGFAAVPLVSGFIQQGMGAGSAMAFLIAGGVSCIPAAPLWAL